MDTLSNIKNDIKNICENYTEETIGGWITGTGPVPCNILFIGEAPGKTEVEKGTPFVGMAGDNFQHYLDIVGIHRSNIRITNTCYFRPIKITNYENGRTSIRNRTPKTSEIELFRDILDREIALVNPKIIITLGNTPLKRFTKFKAIGDCHGKLIFNESMKKYIFPMYHPSSLTYNRSDEFKETYKNDWLELKKALDLI